MANLVIELEDRVEVARFSLIFVMGLQWAKENGVLQGKDTELGERVVTVLEKLGAELLSHERRM